MPRSNLSRSSRLSPGKREGIAVGIATVGLVVALGPLEVPFALAALAAFLLYGGSRLAIPSEAEDIVTLRRRGSGYVVELRQVAPQLPASLCRRVNRLADGVEASLNRVLQQTQTDPIAVKQANLSLSYLNVLMPTLRSSVEMSKRSFSESMHASLQATEAVVDQAIQFFAEQHLTPTEHLLSDMQVQLELLSDLFGKDKLPGS